jgi:osmotically inducible lipoprotein OsmB
MAGIISGSPTARGRLKFRRGTEQKASSLVTSLLFCRSCRGVPMSFGKYVILLTIVLSAAACGDTWGQRAVTGGAIGAGSGAVLGAVTPLGVLPGALIGGAVGAGVGAATTPGR